MLLLANCYGAFATYPSTGNVSKLCTAMSNMSKHDLDRQCCCRVLSGVMFQKDVVAPGRMRRKIHNPRMLLLDCPLEYKKGENQTNVEIEKEEDW